MNIAAGMLHDPQFNFRQATDLISGGPVLVANQPAAAAAAAAASWNPMEIDNNSAPAMEEPLKQITTYHATANHGKSTIESMLANWSTLDSKSVDNSWECKQAAEFNKPSWKVAFGNYRIRKRREAGAALLLSRLVPRPVRQATDLTRHRRPRRSVGTMTVAIDCLSPIPEDTREEDQNNSEGESRTFIVLDGAGLDQGKGSNSAVPIEID